MKISLHVKDGEKKLVLIRESASDIACDNKYILVEDKDSLTNPYLCLTLGDDGRFVINCKSEAITEDKTSLNDKLDSLALCVLEAIQQGLDINETNIDDIEDAQRPYNPENIRIEQNKFSLMQICYMIDEGDLDIAPDFQRNFVWDEFRQSRLIESILLRIPLPVFYFSQDEDGKLHVVDGLQRLSAIHKFMKSKLILKNLEYLADFNGKTFEGKNPIDDKYVRRVNMTQISVNIIDPQSPTMVKFDIFRRLNTGGKPLNAQELRNCLSSHKLRESLKKMIGEPFKLATDDSVSDQRMAAQELALRYLYFRNLYKKNGNISEYSGKMDPELDSFTDKVSHDATFPIEKYIAEFDLAMKNALYLFQRHAFRKVYEDTENGDYRSIINKALFISWAVVLSDYPHESLRQRFNEGEMIHLLGKKISNDISYNNAITYGTNGKANMLKAFEVAEELIQ